jgi:hypothetical protein
MIRIKDDIVESDSYTNFKADNLDNISRSLKKLKDYSNIRIENAYFVFVVGDDVKTNSYEFAGLSPFYVNWIREKELINELAGKMDLFDAQRNRFQIFLQVFNEGKKSFLLATEIYHKFENNIFNDYHIQRPLDSGWKCFDESCIYKPQGFDLDKKIIWR